MDEELRKEFDIIKHKLKLITMAINLDNMSPNDIEYFREELTKDSNNGD